MIDANWRHPCTRYHPFPIPSSCEYLSARIVILFDIVGDGRVARIVVARSSGEKIYDEYAINAIGRASPFPPPTRELLATAAPGSMRIRIVATLDYDSFPAPPPKRPAPPVALPPERRAPPVAAPPETPAPPAFEGTAGIEGESIALDSTDSRFHDYLEHIRRTIKEKWGYPCVKDSITGRCDYKSAKLVVHFGILQDGRVPWIVVKQSSGFEIYDNYATAAIQRAAPFPPVPSPMMALAKPGSTGISIIAAFQYVLVTSP